MRSRIKFDLDENNQEVITAMVTTEGSDDVRDRIAKSFTQKFNGSALCKIYFGSADAGESRFTITPIPDNSEGRKIAAEALSNFSPQPERIQLGNPFPEV